jgi:aryl-alcohol dehydrogenase-like predicted oxidoreductase
MRYNKLGKTDISISAIGLGTVKIGRNQKVKYPEGEGFKLPDDKKVEDILDTALDLGINLLDTAPAYGISEERLGKLLGARREKLVIVSKVGEEFINGKSFYDFSEKHIKMSVYRSLKRLKTDRIESVLLHCHRDDVDILENTPALETLYRLKEKGDILSFGASIYTIEAGEKTVKECDAVMVEYNINNNELKAVIEYAAKLEKAVFIKKGLCSGHLPKNKKNDVIKESLKHIFKEKISSIIIGTINIDHLRHNIAAAEEII